MVAAGASSIVLGGISGSGPAETVPVIKLFVPALVKRGCSPELATAFCSAGGTLALVVPPSAGYILYALVTQRASVADLFLAGIIPGVILGALYICAGILTAGKARGAGSADVTGDSIETRSDKWIGLLVLGTPALILGTIYSALLTVEEAAALSVLYLVLLGTIRSPRAIGGALIRAAIDTGVAGGVILLIVVSASLFAHLIAVTGLAQTVSDALVGFAGDRLTFLLTSLVLLVIAGCFIDGVSLYYIVVPLLLPGMAEYAIDPLYFGVLTTVAVAIGLITPPVGMDLFTASAVTGIPVLRLGRASLPFLVAGIVTLIVLLGFPQVCFWWRSTN